MDISFVNDGFQRRQRFYIRFRGIDPAAADGSIGDFAGQLFLVSDLCVEPEMNGA